MVKEGRKIKKKAGYFISELPLVEKAYEVVGVPKGRRYPLTYIMEAADDISYCLRDISDAIAKKIIKPSDFLKGFQKIWKERYGEDKIPVESLPSKDYVDDFGVDVCVDVSHKAVEAAAEEFVKNYQDFCDSSAEELITLKMPMGRVLDVIKSFW